MGTIGRSSISIPSGIYASTPELRAKYNVMQTQAHKKREKQRQDPNNTGLLSMEAKAATWGILKILGL